MHYKNNLLIRACFSSALLTVGCRHRSTTTPDVVDQPERHAVPLVKEPGKEEKISPIPPKEEAVEHEEVVEKAPQVPKLTQNEAFRSELEARLATKKPGLPVSSQDHRDLPIAKSGAGKAAIAFSKIQAENDIAAAVKEAAQKAAEAFTALTTAGFTEAATAFDKAVAQTTDQKEKKALESASKGFKELEAANYSQAVKLFTQSSTKISHEGLQRAFKEAKLYASLK